VGTHCKLGQIFSFTVKAETETTLFINWVVPYNKGPYPDEVAVVSTALKFEWQA